MFCTLQYVLSSTCQVILENSQLNVKELFSQTFICGQVEPLTGPLEGGILLTIQGSNLGQSFQDIQAGVTVAGVTCTPLPEAYRISTRYSFSVKLTVLVHQRR